MGEQDYAEFLRGCSYHIFWKNVSLNWSMDKVQWRPYGEAWGKLLPDRAKTRILEAALKIFSGAGWFFQKVPLFPKMGNLFRQIV